MKLYTQALELLSAIPEEKRSDSTQFQDINDSIAKFRSAVDKLSEAQLSKVEKRWEKKSEEISSIDIDA
eukprot:CAMPEP_0116936502 /NCGR_PEP_ID=MMETSP0467-20121206/30933_1 /TAXON_ID=283647 /ORGANISM="Mesodinium pulex, Strain SPMC105" /LENGTH=68 /DNA_ID=CAMNT_0004618111 /DNA_START=416 /DNA_END=622 /DNA_ORIENTATION=-